MKYCNKCNNFFPDDLDMCPVDNSRLVETDDAFVGRLLGGCYRIMSKLGSGGMGDVYLARHVYLKRDVAVKVLKPVPGASDELRERALREAKICGTIEHPNIVKVYDMLITGASISIVMELLEGETLKQRIRQEQRINLPASQRLMTMIAKGLARAHSLNIVHRDIKPSNVFLMRYKGVDDFVKLLDFGIAYSIGEARLTQQGRVLGTPRYCSPEQLRNEEPTPAADIYGLGCVVYEMLSGKAPFASDDLEEVISGKMSGDPVPLYQLHSEIPLPFSDIIMKMLKKDAADRYRDAIELLEVLRSRGFYRSALHRETGEDDLLEEAGEDEEEEDEGEEWLDGTREIEWRQYFEDVKDKPGEKDESSDSFREGREAAGRLHEVEKETRLIAQDMEALENKRRAYQINIGMAVEILGRDLARARSDCEKNTGKHKELMAKSAHTMQKVKRAEEKIFELARSRGKKGEEPLLEEELGLLEQAGRLASRLRKVPARAEQLTLRISGNKATIKDMEFQIAQLARSMTEVEEDYAKKSEAFRRRLDEIAGKSEQLRKTAALAARRLGEKMR
ncbi:MAG: protein kinase [Pseudomonadota bacterium]